MVSRKPDWGYFPSSARDLCLVGVQGHRLTPGKSMKPGGNNREMVVFTLCENFPPYRELRHFRGATLDKAAARRSELIREHIDRNYRPAP